MAIRPVDLQAAILQAPQTAAVQRAAEVAPQLAQAAAAQQFASELTHRTEMVHETENLRGNRVEEKKEPDNQQGRGKGKRREHQSGEPFEALGESVLGAVPTDGEHLIDFTA
ncbi:MAG: hypothetical protein JO140_02065 [Candidatus Eremiobacteraeota bacterium]|nr:hypothetical protein [Candidatus Eremiobacteraeota bacterium]